MDGCENGGFTLIELVVYVAILGALAAIAANTLIIAGASLAEIRAERALNAATAVAMERAVRLVRGAEAIDEALSTLGSSPGALALLGPETPPAVSRFAVNSEALLLTVGNQTATLTPPGVAVTELVFRRMAAGTTSEAVRIELTLAASSGRATSTLRSYATVVLRNSYAR